MKVKPIYMKLYITPVQQPPNTTSWRSLHKTTGDVFGGAVFWGGFLVGAFGSNVWPLSVVYQVNHGFWSFLLAALAAPGRDLQGFQAPSEFEGQMLT